MHIFLGSYATLNRSLNDKKPPERSKPVSLGGDQTKVEIRKLTREIEEAVLRKMNERIGTKWETEDIPAIRDAARESETTVDMALNSFLISLIEFNLKGANQALNGKKPAFVISQAIHSARENLHDFVLQPGEYGDRLRTLLHDRTT